MMTSNVGRKRILMVEDDKFMVKLYEARLTAEGFEISVAVTGDACLERAPEFKPDVILLDIMLPLMDGFTVLEKLKANAETADIPVIVFSNRENPGDHSRASQLGAVDFLTKVNTPPGEVVRRINMALESNEGGGLKLPNHYRLAVDIDELDGLQLVQDLGIPVKFEGGKCVTNVVLDVIPEYTHDEPWITGRFVIRNESKE